MRPAPIAGGHGQRLPSTPLESELGFRMGRAHRSLRDAWEGEIADVGLSASQAAMLQAICEHPGTGLRELARRMRTDPMNAKRLADHLEKEGWVRSTSDPFHRQRRDLDPTEGGFALVEELSRRAAAWNSRLRRLLGAGELGELHRLLGRLEDVLAREAKGPRP